MTNEELYLSFNEAARKYYSIKPVPITVIKSDLIEFAAYQSFIDVGTSENKTKRKQTYL